MRNAAPRRNALTISIALALSLVVAPAALAETGGSGVPPVSNPAPTPTPAPGTGGGDIPPPATTPGGRAKFSSDGRTAIAPADAPESVKKAIAAANEIAGKPYKWGGGHGSWRDTGYDCSGAVSYVLRGAGLISSPGDAVVLGRLNIMDRGRGQWITYYWNHQHGYIVIAGLRFDTSGPGPRGPRWRKTTRVSWSQFYARHPQGL